MFKKIGFLVLLFGVLEVAATHHVFAGGGGCDEGYDCPEYKPVMMCVATAVQIRDTQELKSEADISSADLLAKKIKKPKDFSLTIDVITNRIWDASPDELRRVGVSQFTEWVYSIKNTKTEKIDPQTGSFNFLGSTTIVWPNTAIVSISRKNWKSQAFFILQSEKTKEAILKAKMNCQLVKE